MGRYPLVDVLEAFSRVKMEIFYIPPEHLQMDRPAVIDLAQELSAHFQAV